VFKNMEKFIDDISSLYWWLAVVVVGILINVVSTYIRTGLEINLAKISTYWARKKDSRERKQEQLIALLSDSDKALILYAQTEQRFRVRALQNIIFSLIFLVRA
jgi:hypothetical protein